MERPSSRKRFTPNQEHHHMKKTKPAAKPVKKSKSVTLSTRTKTANQVKKKKSKPSTAKRYAVRAEKREVWKKANPGMLPGEIGQQARPAKMGDSDAVAKAMAARIDPDEPVPGPGDEKTAIEVADEVKMEDKLTAKVKLTAVDVTDQIGDRLDTSRDSLTPADEGFDKPVEAKDG